MVRLFINDIYFSYNSILLYTYMYIFNLVNSIYNNINNYIHIYILNHKLQYYIIFCNLV